MTDPTPNTVSQAQEFELSIRRSSVSIGVWSSFLVIAGVAAYVALTWDQPNRPLMAATIAVGLVGTAPIPFLPTDRILESRWREAFFLSWSMLDLVLLAILMYLDGGLESPLAGALILPLIFGSMSYPLAVSALAGAIGLACVGVIAAAAGSSAADALAVAVLMLGAAMLTLWTSSIQAGRRNELEIAMSNEAAARERIELRELQQREVADLGRLALEEPDPKVVLQRVTEVASRVLEAELSEVVLADADSGGLAVAAASGIAQDQVWALTPNDHGASITGLAIQSGDVIIVDDWLTESRVTPAPVVTAMSLRRSIAVPIVADGEVRGALCCDASRTEPFDSRDVSFIRSLCNVVSSSFERYSREAKIRHDALHDPLTGLPNRDLFVDRLTKAIQSARRRDGRLAVLFLDLDQFKYVNDSFGHEAGDDLIRAIAPRVDEVLREEDTIARFGGDEFTIVLNRVEDESEAEAVAQRMVDELSKPFEMCGTTHRIGASVGIAMGDGSSDPESLLRDADTALYKAKNERQGPAMFDNEARAQMVERVQTEQDLREAIASNQLELYFQPILSAIRTETIAVEALVRWNHPTRGIISPADFIPLAERTGLINPLGRWVIDEACRQASRWLGMGPEGRPLGIGINLSAAQLSDNELPALIAAALWRYGIPAETVSLELTETSLMEDRRSIEMLHRLRETGVSIALDDFGTGFSSLSYIKDLPLQAIKIDRSFVASLGPGSIEEAIVSAAVDLARVLGLDIVAEGVETEEQLRRVRDLGCTFVQGFLFSRPVPAGEIGALLGRGPVPDPPARAREDDVTLTDRALADLIPSTPKPPRPRGA